MDTVIKEAKEEIGLDIAAGDVRLLFTTFKSGIPKPGFIENEVQDVFLVEREVDVGRLVVNKDEVSDVRFFKWDEFKNVVEENDRELVVPAYINKLITALD